MSKITIALTLALLALAASEARAWTAQATVTSAWNQQQYKRDGSKGAALTLAAQDASTDCAASLSDLDAATDPTSALTCHNTGDIVLGLHDQVSVELDFTRVAGTAVNMQCDTSQDGGSTWRPVMHRGPSGHAVTTWTTTMSISGKLLHNFAVNAELARCRAWVTTGGATDTVAFGVTLARQASYFDPFYFTAADPLPMSGTVTANQGTSAAVAAPWYVRLSDGTNAIGAANRLPVATIPALTALGSLTDVAADAAVGERTLTIDTSSYSGLSIVINLAWVAATDLTMVVRARSVASGLWGVQHSMAIAAGTVTLSPVTYTRPVSADTEVLIELPVTKYAAVELVFAAPGGGATDLISVQTAGSAGE